MTLRDRAPAERLAWAWHLAFLAAAVVYASVRLEYSEEYRHAPWAALLDGSAPRPFGHRILVPKLAAWLHDGLHVPVTTVFWAFEAAAAWALVEVMAAALALRRPAASAARWSLVGLVVLGVSYVTPRTWPVFYPWDTPALVVIVAAVVLGARARYGWAVVLATVGALNRESAALVPAIVLALRIDEEPDLRGLWAWTALGVAGVLAARTAIVVAMPDNPGPALHFTVHGSYRLHENLSWVAVPRQLGAALAWGGWLLFLWPWRAHAIGWPWRRLGAVALAWAGASLVVANVYEPRAFGEAIALAWIAVVAGPPAPSVARRPAVRWFDATWGWAVLLGLVAAAISLSAWSWLPVAQWPMPR
jgi:hypothetical protein